jgi:hypothetical protein
MPNRIYEVGGVSADGHIVEPDGKSDWSVPDEVLRRFHNEKPRACRPPVGASLVPDDGLLGQGSRRHRARVRADGRRCRRWCSRGRWPRSRERTRRSRAVTSAQN